MKVLVFDCRKVLEINCRKMYVFACFLQKYWKWSRISFFTKFLKSIEIIRGLRYNNIGYVYNLDDYDTLKANVKGRYNLTRDNYQSIKQNKGSFITTFCWRLFLYYR